MRGLPHSQDIPPREDHSSPTHGGRWELLLWRTDIALDGAMVYSQEALRSVPSCEATPLFALFPALLPFRFHAPAISSPGRAQEGLVHRHR